MLAPLMLALRLAAGAPEAPAPPSAATLPERVRPGDAFLVVVRGAAAAPAAAVAGRALTFFPWRDGFAAVAGLPVETPPGPLRIAIALPAPPGATAPGPALQASVEVAPPAFPHRAIEVQKEYVQTPPPAVQRRIEADHAAFAAAFAQPPAPPLFTEAFGWPRDDRVTAHYGEKRTLNGVRPSQHYGVDMAGKLGDPVQASNAGRVVLVRDAYASGWSVVVWHGAGLYTTYLHLSRVDVKQGDAVARGQALGRVGMTGRATGPHLHWGVKVQDLYVDPESVLRLPLAAAAPSAAALPAAHP